MNSSVINSSLPFNQSSSGSSPQLSDTVPECIYHISAGVFLLIERSMHIIVGYPLNLMVMWLVARDKSDSSTSDIFIFNLAIADAWLCTVLPICCFGLQIIEVEGFVHLVNFTTGIKNGSPLFLSCICLDRYVAVVHPIVFNSIKDNKIRVAISMLAWGLMISYALSRSILTYASTIQYHIYRGLILSSFSIMVFCNFSIMWSLRKSVLGKEKMHPMKKKALRTVQIYLGIIVFHYLPTVFISVLRLFTYFPEYCLVYVFLFSIKGYASITQPLLYITQIKQLPLLKGFLCICCRSPSPEPHNVST